MTRVSPSPATPPCRRVIRLRPAAHVFRSAWGGRRASCFGSLDVATLIAFLLHLFYLIEPIAALAMGATQLQAGLAGVSRIDEIAALDVEQDRPAITAPGDLDGRPIVAFDRVSFAYRPDEPVLREVSFSVPPASQTAIVGPSGAGKTTLVAPLERFYDPSGGTITLSETSLHRILARSCGRASATSSRTRPRWPGRCARTSSTRCRERVSKRLRR